MAETDTPHATNDAIAEPGRKPKRSGIACRRCHAHKVKCSGQLPCQRCLKARKGDACEYPPREHKSIVPSSYSTHPQNENQGLYDSAFDQQMQSEANNPMESQAPSQLPSPDRVIRNPLHEPESLFQLDQSSRQHFIGESTCTAFSDRMLQCLHPSSAASTMSPGYRYVQHATFARQLGSIDACKFPGRIRANLLVRVALRFIGQDYHFFLQSDFLQQLEKVYSLGDLSNIDAVWACKFFAVLALGELYSTTTPNVPPSHSRDHSVPGTDYFLTAVGLLQDNFEEPSTPQVENMLLFCFYSNTLGRVKSAHMYSGIAMRISTSLGLHRVPDKRAALSKIEREHRIRLWWSAYIFDRSTSSRLGHPLSIEDSAIEVDMPSWETLDPETKEKFHSPEHLVANIELSRITGLIIRDIYGSSIKDHRGNFVHKVRSILKRLKEWDANIGPSLRWSPGGSNRGIASLQLHFNQCIILTTRPILLHVLKTKRPFASPHSAAVEESRTSPISDTARMLADSCISAARTSNSILSQLYVENALATFGYFDAHHLFSATLVLIISAILSPNSSDSDAVQTSFHLLKTMRDKGNVTASQYYSQLTHIQCSVGSLRSRATTAAKDVSSNNVAADGADMLPGAQVADAAMPLPGNPSLLDTADFEEYDWWDFLAPNKNNNKNNATATATTEAFDWTGIGNVVVDALDNPLLQTFLEHTDASWDEDFGMTNEAMNYMS